MLNSRIFLQEQGNCVWFLIITLKGIDLALDFCKTSKKKSGRIIWGSYTFGKLKLPSHIETSIPNTNYLVPFQGDSSNDYVNLRVNSLQCGKDDVDPCSAHLRTWRGFAIFWVSLYPDILDQVSGPSRDITWPSLDSKFKWICNKAQAETSHNSSLSKFAIIAWIESAQPSHRFCSSEFLGSFWIMISC